MMTPRQSFEEIASLLDQIAECDTIRDARGLIIQAQVHAHIQSARARKGELHATFASLDHLQPGAMQ